MAFLAMMQLIRFGMVGALNTIVGYAMIFGCMYLAGMGAITSNILGYAAGLLVSYTLNRIFTFRSVADKKREIIRFALIFMVAYLANMGALVLLINHWGIHKGWSQLIAGAIYTIIFFVLSKYYVFVSVN